jgi:hypothetical protein
MHDATMNNTTAIIGAIMGALKSHGIDDTWGITVEPLVSTYTGNRYVWCELTEPRSGRSEPFAFPANMSIESLPISTVINDAVVLLTSGKGDAQ